MIKQISYKDTLWIRQQVLWPTKTINELLVPDDENGIHLGYFLDGLLVGVISGYINGSSAQFRKFAVLEEYQGVGYGSLLLSKLISIFYKNSVTYIWCNARKSATAFYEKFGFETKEETTFYKQSIAYVIMQKKGH